MDGRGVIFDGWRNACWFVRQERVRRSRNISMRMSWNKNTWWYCAQKYTEAILCVLATMSEIPLSAQKVP